MTSPPLHTHLPTHHPPSHYEVLQLSPTATEEEIKRAYRSLVVRCHPDKNVSTCHRDETTCWRGGKVEHTWSLAGIDDDEIQGHDYDIDDVSADSKEHCPLERETSEHLVASEDEHFKSIVGTDSAQQKQQQNNDNNSKFHQIQTAYNILRDANKRAAYDESLQRQKDREGWVHGGAIDVNLSEMESDVCSIIYTDDNDTDELREESLQTVYFYQCRCGDTFEIVRKELMEELRKDRAIWQCESCSLAIRICVDIDIT